MFARHKRDCLYKRANTVRPYGFVGIILFVRSHFKLTDKSQFNSKKRKKGEKKGKKTVKMSMDKHRALGVSLYS